MKIDNQKNNQGFTLIELVVVFSLIGIIAAIGVPVTTSYISRQRNFEQMRDFVANLRTYQSQAIAEDKNTYSFSIAGSQIFFKDGTTDIKSMSNPFTATNSSGTLDNLGNFSSSFEFVSSNQPSTKVMLFKYGRIQF